jgi:uncharacterized membrane protein YkvA (DUF1232 family)
MLAFRGTVGFVDDIVVYRCAVALVGGGCLMLGLRCSRGVAVGFIV